HLNFNAQAANADLHAVSAVLHTLLGGGRLTPWFLLLLLVCAVVLDHRLIASAAESTPPLPGQPPLPRLRRRARGRSVALRVRVPADIAPLFRRMALWWVDLPVTLATTVSAITHEFFTVLIAARRGPDTLCDTLRFLRLRRANAMGEARSRGRAWRRHPSEEELTRTARSLARRLGLAATGGITVAATLLFAAVLATEPTGGSGALAYALPALDRFEGWLGTLTVVELAWATLAAIAVTTLLTMGNAVPRAHPRMRDFLRSPTANVGALLGVFAPGQIGYALLGLVGLVLPRRVDRMLVRCCRALLVHPPPRPGPPLGACIARCHDGPGTGTVARSGQLWVNSGRGGRYSRSPVPIRGSSKRHGGWTPMPSSWTWRTRSRPWKRRTLAVPSSGPSTPGVGTAGYARSG